MSRFFKNIYKYWKYAIRQAKAELKSEVADSYLNWLWWIIEPFCFMCIYTFIFTKVFPNNTPYFASFVMIGQAIWDFINRMITGSVKLIINNRDLVTKVYVPKYVLLISKSFTYLFKFFIALGIAFALMAFQHVPLTLKFLQIIPVIISMYLASFGIGCILMHFGVTLNDLANLTNIVMKMVFYLSGIFYNIKERLTGRAGYFLLRGNPVAFLMSEIRDVCIFGKNLNVPGIAFWMLIGIGLTSIGVHLIHKYENSYAKVI